MNHSFLEKGIVTRILTFLFILIGKLAIQPNFYEYLFAIEIAAI